MAPGYARMSVGLMSSTPVQINGKGSAGDLSEVIVDVDRVTAHAAGGWVTVSETPVTVDILRLGDSAVALGFGDLPAGKITQIRLHVLDASAPYVTLTADGSQVPLKVPSGMQSGIKIQGPWNLDECSLTSVTLDLDRKKSIHVHPTGHEDLWILRPVIRAGGTSTGVGCDDGMTPPDGGDGTMDPNDPGDGSGGNGGPDDGTMDPGDPSNGGHDGNGGPDHGMLDPTNPGGGDGIGVPGDADGDGIPDSMDPDGGSGTGVPGDADGDGIPDSMDPDGGSGTGGPDPTTGGGDGGTCQSSSECGPTSYCGPSGICIPVL